MKKLLFMLVLFCAVSVTTKAQDFAGYLAVKDTLTNTETLSHELAVVGSKSAVSFQINIIKLTGTVAGTVKVFGSVDGTTYSSFPISSDTLVDATTNYAYSYTHNGYKKYKVQISTTGTGTASERVYALYRK